MGEVTTEWDDGTYDFSDINGTYIITEDTKYKKGFDRLYKQVNGKYYIGGYNADAEEWSDFSNHWFISETKDGYGNSAKAYFEGDNIPSGANNWYSWEIGTLSIPTEVTNTEVTALSETFLARSITAFNAETSEWTEGDTVDISSYSLLPQTNGIYFAQGGKLIGQHIDRELHIPENGLVRRFKAVDGHFVDTVWGTEMMPTGDISYDELGFHGNNSAPMAVKEGSYLSCQNTLTIPDNMTMVCFVKPYSGTGLLFGFGDKSDDQADIAFQTHGATFRGQIEQFDTGIVHGRWNVLVMTRIWDNSNRKVTAKLYTNGKPVHSIENESLMREHGRSYIGVMADSAVFSSSGSVIGQIDEACIWNRILTDEEIADIKDIDKSVAYVDKMWMKELDNSAQYNNNVPGTITMTEYRNPGNIIYKSSCEAPKMAVFSEVYYKTWKAYIDGKEVTPIRANYVLRALPVPAGEHTIEFKCVDELMIKSHNWSLYMSWLVGVVLVGLIAFGIYRNVRKEK
jgi:hypothetical protein